MGMDIYFVEQGMVFLGGGLANLPIYLPKFWYS